MRYNQWLLNIWYIESDMLFHTLNDPKSLNLFNKYDTMALEKFATMSCTEFGKLPTEFGKIICWKLVVPTHMSWMNEAILRLW